MQVRRRSHRLLALVAFIALVVPLVAGFVASAGAQEAAPQPTIASDLADYPPGGTVVLTGSNWQPGESVNIVVDDDGVDERDWRRDVTVTADENGDIRDEFQLPDWFVANYTVKATGAQSGTATTTFTDALAKIEGKDKGGTNYRSTGGPLDGWDELEKVPMRLAFTNSGSQTVTVSFDHTSTSGRRIPAIRDLVDWTAANARVTSLNAQLTDTSGAEWAYTVQANLSSGTNNSNPGYVTFGALLAAGSHAYPGASMHINLSGDGTGTAQIDPSDVLAPRPDLVVNKTGPGTAAPGSTITYRLNYKNVSTTDTATGAVLTDVLPAGVTFVDCSNSCTVQGNEISWVVGNLAPGAGTDPDNPLSRTLRVMIPSNAANGASFVNNSDILSANDEQDLSNCGSADSDNNVDNDSAGCDNYDSLKTTVLANQAPVAVNDSYSVNEDQILTVPNDATDVLGNDTDADGNNLTAALVGAPSHGTVVLNANGSFTYTPQANYSGPDSFTYKANDGTADSNTATVNITVNPVNDTPSFTKGDNQTVNEDSGAQTVAGWASAISAGPGESGQNVSFVLTNDNNSLFSSQPAISSGGQLTYTPAVDKNGSATVMVRVKDDNGTPGDASDDVQSAAQTFTITVNPVNDAPGFTKGANHTVDEDSGARTINPWATNISRGPSDEAGQSVNFIITNNTNNALFSAQPTVSDDGTLSYTPAADESGSATITLKIQDSGGTANGGVDQSATQSFTITVNAVNDAPVAVNDAYNMDEDDSLTVPAPGVLGNDTDIDGGALTSARNGGPSNGTLTLNADGSFVYTPNANYNGPDSFTYTVSDGKGGTDTARANITVAPVNDTPVAKDLTGNDDRITTPEDTPKGITLTASDVDSTNLTFTIVGGQGPTNGTLTGTGANRTYTPNQNYNGPDAFKFRVCDDSAPTPLCDTGDVEILVTPVNDAPVAVNDSYTEDEGQTLTVNAPGLLANDTDIDSGALKVCEIRVQRDGSTATASGTNITIRNDEGTVTSDGTGAFTFNPADDDYFGTFTFQYKACDANNTESAYATVTITYNNVNDAPRVDLNGSAAGAGDAATFTEGGGGIDVDTDRNLTVTDVDHANMQSGSVTLLNRKAGDVISINETLAGTLGIGVTNDGATTGEITLTNVQNKADYQALLRTVRFNNGSQNPDTADRNVEFAVVDNGGLSSNKPDSVVTVIEVNDAPNLTASNDGPIDEGEAATITGTATDPDTPAGDLRYSFDCDNNGTYEKGPQAAKTAECSFADDGDYTVNVKVTDGEGGSDTASTVVTVNNVPPTVTGPENTNQSSNEGENKSFDLGSFTDPGNDSPWTVTVDWGDGSPAESFNANAPGSLGQRQHSYDDNGTYDVTVTVDEANAPAAIQAQGTNSATFTATVANVAPTATLDAPASVDEGDDINFSLTNPSDPSGADTQAGFQYAFKCDGGSYGAFGPSDASNCPTTDDGNYAVSARIQDKDGGESEYTGTVTVNNAAPKVTSLTGPALVEESTTLERTYNFNATDAGDDALTIEVDCGANGALVDTNGPDTPGGTYTYDPATGDGSFKCVFADGGPTSDPTLSNVKVKVTDEDGATDAENRTVSVTVDNDDPQATFNAPASVNEGDSFDITLTDPSDPAGANDTLSFRFDCGSGFGDYGSGTTRTCATSDNGTITVRGQVADEDGGQSPVYEKTVTVNNVAPRVVLSGPETADEGDTKDYTYTVADRGADTFTVENGYPTCGANGTLVGTPQVDASGGSFSCRFPDGDATSNVEVSVRDDDGAVDADGQRVVIVAVANVAPVLTIAADQTADEGASKGFDLGSFTDPGDDASWSVSVDWGDGSTNTTFDSASPGNLPQKPHTYADDGTYTVTVKVTEAGGATAPSDTKTFTVTVNNVAPTALDDSMTTTELREVKANLLDNDEDPGNDLDRASMTLLSVETSPNASGGLAAANVTSSLLTAGGSVSIDELLDGNVTYKPNRGFVDIDAFRYEVCDDDGDCSRANVDVEVGPVDCDAQGVIRGTERADVLRGTAGDDIICALGGNDRIYAGGGDDLLVGDAGWDRMWAETGNDVMRGGSDTDTMDAGLGEDYLSGDEGRDIMMGRGDADFLEMKDGSAGDAGNGGAGIDTCSKDTGDKAVSCERRQ